MATGLPSVRSRPTTTPPAASHRLPGRAGGDRCHALRPCLSALALTTLIAGPCLAEPEHATPKRGVKSTVKEAARTGGHTARDGALTFGRSAKAFFTDGPSAARKVWKANAAKTKRTAKAGAAATKAAAQ